MCNSGGSEELCCLYGLQVPCFPRCLNLTIPVENTPGCGGFQRCGCFCPCRSPTAAPMPEQRCTIPPPYCRPSCLTTTPPPAVRGTCCRIVPKMPMQPCMHCPHL